METRMAIHFAEEFGCCRIILEDFVDISHAAELKRTLMQALRSTVPLCIQVSGATAIDVTIVQLLWAAVRYASAAGTKLTFEGGWSEDIERSFSQSGLVPMLQCFRTQSSPGGNDGLAVRQ
jgi:anti-anti-sigma regulatory factor